MELASIILSTIALVISLACLVWLLAKQLSSHQITYVDPMANMTQSKVGESIFDQFREIGEKKNLPIGDD